ncbi:DUF4113 domain-containing protein [Providencia manganoxydans]
MTLIFTCTGEHISHNHPVRLHNKSSCDFALSVLVRGQKSEIRKRYSNGLEDQLNNSGIGKVWFAGKGVDTGWRMKREMLSPAYTTNIKELPIVRI